MMNFKIFAYLMMCSTLGSGMDDGKLDDLSEIDWGSLIAGFQPETLLPQPVVPVAPELVKPVLDEDLDKKRSCSSPHEESSDGDDSNNEEYRKKLKAKKRLRSKSAKASQTVASPAIEDLPTDVYSGPILGTLDELVAYFGLGPNLKQEPGRPAKQEKILLPTNWIMQVYVATERNGSLTRCYFGGIHRDKLMSIVDPDFRKQRNMQQVINKKRRNEK